MVIRVSIVGATGKLGQVVRRLVDEADDLDLVAALSSADDLEAALGSADRPADVIVDTTVPAVSHHVVELGVTHGRKVLVGTSGWAEDRILALRRRVDAVDGPGVVIVPNFSLGSALASAFAAAASRFYDSIEIVEAHGPTKVDSPSGTAVRTAELIAAARGDRGPVDAPHNDQRARGQRVAGVPVHSLRTAGVVARQQVLLGGAGELLVLDHQTIDSSAYEAGILLGIRAASREESVTVGLDSLIDLGIATPRIPPPDAVRDAQ